MVLVFSICLEELLRHKKMPLRRDYRRVNYDEIRAKLNEIDWAVEFSDKNVNECYKILLKFHEEIIEECVPKNIDKTEDERKRMKQKQKWQNRKVKSVLRKRDDNWLKWKRHNSNENLIIYHKMTNNATIIKRKAKTPSLRPSVSLIFGDPRNFAVYIPSQILYPRPKMRTPKKSPPMKTKASILPIDAPQKLVPGQYPPIINPAPIIIPPIIADVRYVGFTYTRFRSTQPKRLKKSKPSIAVIAAVKNTFSTTVS